MFCNVEIFELVLNDLIQPLGRELHYTEASAWLLKAAKLHQCCLLSGLTGSAKHPTKMSRWLIVLKVIVSELGHTSAQCSLSHFKV